MERIDISDGRSLADLVASVERGEEVVIVREGAVVAELRAAEAVSDRRFDLAALESLRARFPIRIDDGGALIRQLRDADDL